jgi:catechol 2,3-dioxygenase-like lactoylglutathione lyase family enzyme
LSSLTTPAIVLRVVNYGEADRIVTLFGRDTGRLSALARGARKSQRRFAGGLGLCALGTAAVRERAGAELGTLERFDATESYPALGSDVARMAHAAYAAELVGKLCAPHQVEVAVFDWLVAFLRLLDADGASAERLRVFEIGLLSGLGFGPVLDTCATCGGDSFGGRAPAEIAFRWDPDRGGGGLHGVRARRATVAAGRAHGAGPPVTHAARGGDGPGAAARRQPRLPRGAARDHQPSRERAAQDRRIHCQGRARRGRVVTRPPMLGIRHVALYVGDLAAAERFWVDVMGYAVEWRPDPDNVYLCGARDNLALHRKDVSGDGRLDHIGIAVAAAADVDAWAAHLEARGVAVKAAPRTHRDGSRSLYFHGPEGLLVQIIHHAPMSAPG